MAALSRTGNLYKQLALVMGTVAHDGLLRGGEITSGLKPTDVYFNMTNKHWVYSSGVQNRIGPVARLKLFCHGANSGYQLLLDWFNQNNLWKRQDIYIFPYIHPSTYQLIWTKPTSSDRFRQFVKHMVASVGLPADLSSGHSCRAGGATDLFIVGVDYCKIKKFGRWVSDAALIYFRDEEDVVQRVKQAFASFGTTGIQPVRKSK